MRRQALWVFKFIVLALVSGGMLACASAPRVPEPESAEAKMFINKCTVCHSWPHPSRHSAAEWDHYLNIMAGHMKNSGISFSQQERQMIQSYLHRNAR